MNENNLARLGPPKALSDRANRRGDGMFEGKGGQRFSGSQRQELIERLGGLPLRNGKDLVERVNRLAALTIGKIRVDFTPQEWEWIFARCGYTGDYGCIFFD